MEVLKKGKRTYGAFVDTGKCLIYCAYRNPKDFFLDGRRGSFQSIGDGLENGNAAWAIDDLHLMEARRRGCKYIAIWVRKLNWLFMTPIETFYDPKTYYRRNYTGRGGSDQRYVSVKHFAKMNREMKLGPQSKRKSQKLP